jgi:hypothetical protein
MNSSFFACEPLKTYVVQKRMVRRELLRYLTNLRSLFAILEDFHLETDSDFLP